MARKEKVVELEGLNPYPRVYELTVKQIKHLVFDVFTQFDNMAVSAIYEVLKKELVPLICSYPIESLEDLAPSEIELLIEAAKEVNSVFWKALDQVGILPDLKARWGRIMASMPSASQSVTSTLAVIDALKNMDGPGSSSVLSGQEPTSTNVTEDSVQQ